MTHPQLEMDKPRVFEDFKLKDVAPDRVKEISVVESAYDSVLCKDFTYVSTPITSGQILYTALDSAGVTDVEELKKDKSFFYQNVILPNITSADSVAQAMLLKGGAVIAPAIFEAKSLAWGQDEYMGLWLDVIERKATCIAMVDGWQYSNGGCEEYLQALLMQAGRRDRNNIRIVDAKGDTITHHQALTLMSEAVTELLNRNHRPTTLARVLHRCVILHDMVANESEYGISTDQCGKTFFPISPFYSEGLLTKDERRSFFLDIRFVLLESSYLLRPEDLSITSSDNLHPGLIRQAERAEMEKLKMKVQKIIPNNES